MARLDNVRAPAQQPARRSSAPEPAAALVVARDGERLSRQWIRQAGARLTSGQREDYDRSVRNQFAVAAQMVRAAPNDEQVIARAWDLNRAALRAWERFRQIAERQSTPVSRAYASTEEAATQFFNQAMPVVQQAERAASMFGAGFGLGAIALIGGAVLFFSRRRG